MAATVRIGVGCALCSDFRNLKPYRDDLADQGLPQNLLKGKSETLPAWRDRLYHQFRLPTIISALGDLRFAYMEQSAPLLSRRILRAVRQLRDDLRTNKILFKRIVGAMSPKIEFASSGAIASPQQILRDERIVDLLKEELSSEHLKQVVPAGLLGRIVEGMETGRVRTSRWDAYSRRVKTRLLGGEVDYNVLAFRVFIISRMNTLLSHDSRDSANIVRS